MDGGCCSCPATIDPQKQLVSDLITSFGYAVIDLGDLDEGGCFQQPRGPLAGKDLICCSQAEARSIGQRCKWTARWRWAGRLKGKVLLVTGGELGAATAKALAEQGATFNSFSKLLYRDRSNSMRTLEAPWGGWRSNRETPIMSDTFYYVLSLLCGALLVGWLLFVVFAV
jgi:hypothetical protein